MGQSFSEDGRLMAYALSSGGSDWRTVKVMEVDQQTGAVTHRPDVLDHVKFRWAGGRVGGLGRGERRCAGLHAGLSWAGLAAMLGAFRSRAPLGVGS
jgi:hypothetical protein